MCAARNSEEEGDNGWRLRRSQCPLEGSFLEMHSVAGLGLFSMKI